MTRCRQEGHGDANDGRETGQWIERRTRPVSSRCRRPSDTQQRWRWRLLALALVSCARLSSVRAHSLFIQSLDILALVAFRSISACQMSVCTSNCCYCCSARQKDGRDTRERASKAEQQDSRWGTGEGGAAGAAGFGGRVLPSRALRLLPDSPVHIQVGKREDQADVRTERRTSAAGAAASRLHVSL